MRRGSTRPCAAPGCDGRGLVDQLCPDHWRRRNGYEPLTDRRTFSPEPPEDHPYQAPYRQARADDGAGLYPSDEQLDARCRQLFAGPCAHLDPSRPTDEWWPT